MLIPPGLRSAANSGISGASSCDGGGTPAYVHSVDYAASRPVIQLKWEQGGDEPVPPMASPGSALRNPATGELIAWRVRPGGPIRYTDVPVRLYVADTLVYHDSDGNIVESFRKVGDAEICVGVVHWHYDPDACPDPSCNVRTVTCDQVFTGETTVLAYTEPEWSGGYFDGPIGVAAGVSKVSDQAGSYYLIAEPLDEAFRRGDAWMVAMEVIWTLEGDPYYAGTYRKAFEVGGGMYLDENLQPFTEGILVGTTRQVFVKLYSGGSEDPLPVDVSFVVDGSVQSSVALNVPRVGATSSGQSVYLGDFELHVPSAGAKSIGEGPQIEGTGTLITAVNEVAQAGQLASEVWVEVEQVLDKDDNDVTGTELDVKQMAPLTIRYRIKGTDQQVGHSLTVLEFAADESNQVHTDFYGGPGAIVSDVVDESPDVIVNGYYETEWEGRDNTGDDRLLIQGEYQLDADVTIAQRDVEVTAEARDPFGIDIGPPQASAYGPLYWSGQPTMDPRDFMGDILVFDAALSLLHDSTEFLRLGQDDSRSSSASEVVRRLKEMDAVFFYSGHTEGGSLSFYGYDDIEPVLSRVSQLVSTEFMNINPHLTTEYTSDLQSRDLKDVFLVINCGCYTDYPPGDLLNNVTLSMISKGADLALGFGTSSDPEAKTKRLLGEPWIANFWPLASGQELVSGLPLTIEEAHYEAVARAIELNGWRVDQIHRNVFLQATFHHAVGVTASEYLWPARYGNSSNGPP